ERAPAKLAARRRGAVGGEERRDRRARREAVRPRPREELREEVRAIRRGLEEGLVEELLQEVPPPDVDDERELRPERRDVGEVLLGPDADVNAARGHAGFQLRDHALESALVREEVLRRVGAARLR